MKLNGLNRRETLLGLTTAMGPVLIVAMAALVGFFALAVYMPMWDLAKLATHAR